MASRRQEVIVEMKLDKTSLAAVQSEIRQAFALAEQAQQLRQTNGRSFLGGQRISGARAELISQSGKAAEELLPGLLQKEATILSVLNSKKREETTARNNNTKAIEAENRALKERERLNYEIDTKRRPSSNIYEHRKIEEARQNAQKLATILHGNAALTKDQLDKSGRIWGQFSQTVKRHDQELYDTISAGFFKQKEILHAKIAAERTFLQQKQAIERQVLLNEKAAALELTKTQAEYARVEREWKAKILAANKAHNKAKLDEDRRALREQRLLQVAQGRATGRGGLELGGGATGRGLISGFAGLGGVNLYGLGVLGAGAAGTRAALNAYADVFNTKNVLAGIVQTFSQFKDSGGRPLDRAANFEQSQKYSEYLYGRVRKAAVDSPLTLKELTDVYTTGVPFLARSGVSFEKSIGVTNTVASLGKMMGLRLDSIKDDIRAIYEGRFRNVQTFQAAGFTSADFEKLSNLRGDNLVKFFDQKFAGYQDALKKFAGSFTAQWDRLKDSLYQSAALIGEKVAPVFVKFSEDMQKTLGQWVADGTLTRFTEDFSSILKAVGEGSVILVSTLTTVAGAFSRAAQTIADTASGLLGSVNQAGWKDWLQAGLDVATGNTGAWAGQQRQMLNSLSGANLTGLERQGAIIGGLESLQREATPLPIKISGYGSQDTLKIQKREDTFRLRNFVSDNKTARSEFSDQMSSLETIEKTLRYARIIAKAETAWENNPKSEGARTDYYDALNKYRPIIAGNLKKVAPHLNANDLILGAKVEGPTNSYIKAVLPLALQGFVPSGAANQLLQVQAQIKAQSIETKKKFSPDFQKMQGVSLALDYLQQHGYNTDKLTPEQLSSPEFIKLIDNLKKNAAPGMINTAPRKTTKTTKTPKTGGAGLSAQSIEPDVTSELDQISAIAAKQFELQKREAHDEDVSAEYRSLESKKNSLERQMALKQANKTTVLTGGGSVQALAGSYQDKLRAFAKASGGKVHLGKMSRTFEEQTKLWNDALKKYGSAEKADDWVARPGTSNHEFGLANDLSFGRGGVRWAHANAAKFGLGFPMKHENWHIELAGGSKSARLRLQLENKTTVAGNKSGQIDNRFDEKDRALELEAIREAVQKQKENKRIRDRDRLSNVQYELRKTLAGTDAPAIYAAKLKILNTKYPRSKKFSTEYRDEKAQLDQEFEDAKRQATEGYAADNEATIAKAKARQREAFSTQFKNREGLIGLFGSDLARARLDQNISSKEDMMSKGGIGGAWAATILPALYEQRRALDKNTDALNKQLTTKFNNAVKGIFGAPEFLSPSQTYRKSFDKKIEAIDNMSSSDLNAYRASMGMAGMGYTDEQLRGMLKLQATKGFSSQGFRTMQHRDQLFGGANAFLSALQSGGDPITAFANSYQNIDGQEAQQRLIQGLFNRGSYQKMGKMSRKMHFDKGAFNKDLISGGGSLVANMLVGTMGGQAQMGSQIGGMLAPLLFTGLGAWAGPLGILGGGLIGSLFGKKKQVDPSIEQHRKRLEELLQSINNRLKPQEDFYRTIKGSVLWGSASRSFGGRASSLGARVALGVI